MFSLKKITFADCPLPFGKSARAEYVRGNGVRLLNTNAVSFVIRNLSFVINLLSLPLKIST